MNFLMMTLMYPQDQFEEVSKNAKDKLQNQINNYQRAFVEGIRSNLLPSEKFSVLNALPVGIFPFQYKELCLKSGLHDEDTINQIGCINLPWFKQTWRCYAAAKELTKWLKEEPDNRTVIVYTQYLPYMKALHKVKKRFPDLKAAVIVTDLPNEMGLASGRKGLLKKIEYRMGKKSIDLLQQMDGYVLLTDPMADALRVRQKPYTVIEGLILSETMELPAVEDSSPVFLYTGTLERDLGIGEMLQAFAEMPEYQLWICGQGNMSNEVETFASRFPNIHYFGFVSQAEALAKQASATALLNPRQADGLFTRYSFPSKTLEYMRSGKPVLCCKLEGIPADYDPYLCYMEAGKAGIVSAVRQVMMLSDEERKKRGSLAKEYVLQHKNPLKQCQKLLGFLRKL